MPSYLRHARRCLSQQCAGRALRLTSWTHSAGNFWLFGGYGYSSNGELAASTICGDTVRAPGCGPGSVAAMPIMPAGSTARWAPPRPATCRGRVIQPSPGSTPPAICGCSAAMATTAAATSAGSMTCGNTARVPVCGPGSAAPARTMPSEPTGRRARPWPAIRPARARRPVPGSTPPATCGCSAAMATVGQQRRQPQ